MGTISAVTEVYFCQNCSQALTVSNHCGTKASGDENILER